nr:MAG TPA: hypothetical protein [Caudoviricetes sp.]
MYVGRKSISAELNLLNLTKIHLHSNNIIHYAYE